MAPNSGFLLRVIDQLTLCSLQLCLGFSSKTRCLHWHITTISPMIATYTCKLKRKPYVFEVRDIWPASPKAVGLFSEGKIYHLLENWSYFSTRRHPRVVVTDAFKKNLSIRGIAENKTHVVTNGTDLMNSGTQPHSAKTLRLKLKLKEKFTCGCA